MHNVFLMVAKDEVRGQQWPQCVCLLITGLVQRCVIIQRDENGFGLTVSGDNPVFVQLVKEGKILPKTNSTTSRLRQEHVWLRPVCGLDGAALRAGVQTGDRIVKVGSCFPSWRIQVTKHLLSRHFKTFKIRFCAEDSVFFLGGRRGSTERLTYCSFSEQKHVHTN